MVDYFDCVINNFIFQNVMRVFVLFFAILFFSACVRRGESIPHNYNRYRVVECEEFFIRGDVNYVIEDIDGCYVDRGLRLNFVDSVGKFKVGDTVILKIKPRK